MSNLADTQDTLSFSKGHACEEEIIEIITRLITEEAKKTDGWTKFILLSTLDYLYGKPLPEIDMCYVSKLYAKFNATTCPNCSLNQQFTDNVNIESSPAEKISDNCSLPDSQEMAADKIITDNDSKDMEVDNTTILFTTDSMQCPDVESTSSLIVDCVKKLNSEFSVTDENCDLKSIAVQTDIEGIESYVLYYNKVPEMKEKDGFHYRKFDMLKNLIPVDNIQAVPIRSRDMYSRKHQPLFHGHNLNSKDENCIIIPLRAITNSKDKLTDPRLLERDFI